MFGMSEPERTVKDAGLLSEGESPGAGGWSVCEQLEGATRETERPDVRAGRVLCVVFGFALC
jgi:hypothetical protein